MTAQSIPSIKRRAACVVLAVATTAVAQAGSKPKNLKGKDIVQLDVILAEAPSLKSLIPGMPVSVNIVATDKKGRSYSTGDQTLGTQDLRVTATLGTYDPTSRSFAPEPDKSRVGDSPYTIRVECGPLKDFKDVTKSFEADFAAIEGPEPETVQSLDFAAGPDPEFLVPGSEVSLRVVATDKEGRAYLNVDSPPRLPLDRLDVRTELVAWDPARAVLTPEADFSRVAGRVYSISVQYRGQTDLEVRKTYIADFAAIRGPEPPDVTSLDIRLPGVPTNGLLVPGATLGPLDVEVKDKYGRIFTLRQPDLKLPPTRLEVSLGGFQYDADTGKLRAHPDARAMVDREYSLSVAYTGRKELVRTLRLAPDFLGAVKPFLFDGDKLELVGTAGEAGAKGSPGQSGPNGQNAGDVCGSGAPGRDGTQGRVGGKGGRGGRGPRLKVVAAEVLTADQSTRLILVEVTMAGEPSKYFLRRPEDRPLALIAAGGAGGAGGPGGGGGNAGLGGSGWSTGSGGDGGDGGDGGSGGPGGPGGDVTLIVSDRELAASFDLQTLEGLGGPGGASGGTGTGGDVGKSGAYIGAAVTGGIMKALGGSGQDCSYVAASAGSPGRAGQPGMAGEAGPDGAPGRASVTLGPEPAGLAARIPEELARLIVFPASGTAQN